MTARRRRARGSASALVWLAAAGTGLAGLAGCNVNVPPGDPGPSDVRLTIDLLAVGTPISPYIYGTNSATNLAANRATLVRLGGNRWTAYNWENNASNAGSDWCFQNDGFLAASNSPAAAVTPSIDTAQANGAAVLVTVPIVDHVAADKNGGCDVRNSGPNYLQTRFRQNRATKPTAATANPDPNDAYVYQDEYVRWLKANRPNASIMFSLDNEPDLWAETHAEVHPNPVTYAELVQRNLTYAAAIKTAWPGAIVTGPASYGFSGFENLQGASDANGRNFLDVYLSQIRAAETAQGRRLVDLLDLHWYPEAQGNGVRITGTDTSAAVVAARVQAPRSLWDPGYLEQSWITAPNQYNYGPIRLLPRTRERIAARAPGTGIALTEWNYGGGGHISGAVASADVLGVLGREGVQAANMWELNADERFTYAAFRAFRNYDGSGGAFGDLGQPASTSDVGTTTVYASTSSGDRKRAVIVAINKSTSPRRAGITLTGSAYTKAKVYTVTAAGGANVVPAGTINTVATNAFNYQMPAMSVNVIVPEA